MITYIVFGFIFVCVCGIVFFTRQKTPLKKDRMHFLKDLEEFFEASLVPIVDYEDSYSISFTFEERQFVYQDILSPSFRGFLNRTLMKGRTNTPLSLGFSEKEKVGFLEKEKKKEKTPPQNYIRLPKAFNQFSAYSNSPEIVNKLFEDPQMARIFSEFKNVDSRGRPMMTFKISDGWVVLEFHPSGKCHPRPLSHLDSLESLEEYLDKMILVMQKIESLY